MPVITQWYGKALTHMVRGDIDFDADVFKIMLTGTGYVPDPTTDEFRNNVTNEIAGSGYSAGGMTLAGVVVSEAGSTYYRETRVVWNQVYWPPPATFSARNAVIYKARGGLASADELIAYIDFAALRATADSGFKIVFGSSVLTVATYLS